jgi:hypothetical protein
VQQHFGALNQKPEYEKLDAYSILIPNGPRGAGVFGPEAAADKPREAMMPFEGMGIAEPLRATAAEREARTALVQQIRVAESTGAGRV